MAILRLGLTLAEFAFVICLMIGSVQYSMWCVAGLIGYFVFSAAIGGEVVGMALMGGISLLVAVGFIAWGFWGAIVVFFVLLVVGELVG